MVVRTQAGGMKKSMGWGSERAGNRHTRASEDRAGTELEPRFL